MFWNSYQKNFPGIPPFGCIIRIVLGGLAFSNETRCFAGTEPYRYYVGKMRFEMKMIYGLVKDSWNFKPNDRKAAESG